MIAGAAEIPWSRNTAIWAAAAFALVFLARLVGLHLFAVDLPFFDQWDGEGRLLLLLERGDLSWTALTMPHNEHRIFWSRLICIGLYLANDRQWDNLVIATFNALVFAMFTALGIRMVLRELPGSRGAVLCGFVLLTACLPIAWENWPIGFQGVFFYLNGLTVLGIWQASSRQPSVSLLVCLSCIAIACLFTLASGLFSPLAFAATMLIRWWRADATRGSLVALSCATMAGIALCGALMIPNVPHHAVLRAHNFMDMWNASTSVLSWPLPGYWLCALISWLPFLAAGVCLVRGRISRELDIAAFAIGGWVLVQALAMAYSRGHGWTGSPSTRYVDTLAFGLLANTYFAVRLFQLLPRRGWLPALTVSVLLVADFSALLLQAADGLTQLEGHAARSVREIDHVRRYLAHSDFAELDNKPFLDIPYPDAKVLAALLDDRVLRAMLPASVRTPLHINGNAVFVSDGYYPTTPHDGDHAVFGSYLPSLGNANTGRLEQSGFSTSFPYLMFDVAGYLNSPGLSLSLSAKGAEHKNPVVVAVAPHESWMHTYVRNPRPGAELTLEAIDDNTAFWFAFSEPVEIGALSMAVGTLLAHSFALMLSVFGLMLLAALSCWLKASSERWRMGAPEAALAASTVRPSPRRGLRQIRR